MTIPFCILCILFRGQKYKRKISHNVFFPIEAIIMDMDPFLHCMIPNFIPSQNFLEGLQKELLNLDFHEKCNDLYKFQQVFMTFSISSSTLETYLQKNHSVPLHLRFYIGFALEGPCLDVVTHIWRKSFFFLSLSFHGQVWRFEEEKRASHLCFKVNKLSYLLGAWYVPGWLVNALKCYVLNLWLYYPIL